LGVVLVGLLSAATAYAGDPGADRPNVLWLVLDAVRAQNLSCYGYERETSPTLDALAEQGVLFEEHFTQSNVTINSVPSYMSGLYFPPPCHEPTYKLEYMKSLGPEERWLPEVMRTKGYQTVMFTASAWFTRASTLGQAFEESSFVKVRNRPGHVYAPFEDVSDVLFEWLSEHRGAPFFAYVHVMDTHFPHLLEPPYDRWLIPGYVSASCPSTGMPPKALGSAFTRQDQEQLNGLYDGSINYCDAQIAILVERLRNLGVMENTILIIGSDHGEILGEDGTTWGHGLGGHRDSLDAMMHVPLIMAGPGFPSGMRVKALTQNADIMPTLVEFLGLDTDAEMDGKSFLALARGETTGPLHRYVFARRADLLDGPIHYILRDTKYKYGFSEHDGSERLWRVPDEVAGYEDVFLEETLAANRMRTYLGEELQPRYDAYKRRPVASARFSVLGARDADIHPAQAFVRVNTFLNSTNAADGKWAILTALKALCAAPWLERVQPVTVHFENMPPGRYTLQAELATAREWWGGHGASSVSIRVQGDSEFRQVDAPLPRPSRPGWVFVDVGVCEIQERTLDVTVDVGDTEQWAVVRRLQLVRETGGDAKAPSEEDPLERMEQLRALGYLED